jgi:hypothetical protein
VLFNLASHASGLWLWRLRPDNPGSSVADERALIA